MQGHNICSSLIFQNLGVKGAFSQRVLHETPKTKTVEEGYSNKMDDNVDGLMGRRSAKKCDDEFKV